MRQPIGGLTDFLSQRHIHLTVQTANVFSAQLRRVIKTAQTDALASGDFRIARENSSFPLGLQEIPVRANLARLRRLGMVRNILANIAEIDKNVSVLGVDVVMLTEPPLRFIDDLGKDQCRAHAVQDFRAVQNFVGGGRSGDVSIDKILTRAPLRHNLGRKRITSSRGYRNVDLGVFFLKLLRHRAELALALEKIKIQAAFLFRRLHRPLPFGLPVWFEFRGVRAGDAKDKNEADDNKNWLLHIKLHT